LLTVNGNEPVEGLENIAKALGFNWSKQADVKKTYRALRRFKIPFEKNGNKILVYQKDIANYRKLLIGKKKIAHFLGISQKTLSKWLKTNRRLRGMFSGDKTIYIEKKRLWLWNEGRKLRKIGIDPKILPYYFIDYPFKDEYV
jgi:hypothetical protein